MATIPAVTPQYNFNVNLDDLAFILKQIQIAEASTTPDGQIANLPALVGSPLLPYGLRTVDGTWNNLLPGMERLGAADNIMPRLVTASFSTAEARPAGLFAPTAGTVVTSYAQSAPGNIVYDSQPRIISNLIVDQTAANFAAVIAAETRAEGATFPGLDVLPVTAPGDSLFIPNQSPDIGLSPPFNGVMTLFGQFFDHGLDLITKGGGTVYVPLMPDDPLYVEGSPLNFMVLSRAANLRTGGADGIVGTSPDDPNGADDVWVHEHTNTTTPFVDQNQTYTSHPSHQVFLREYEVAGGQVVDTGRLLDGSSGAGNWAEVKTQAANVLGIQLTDHDVFNVPLLATDRYGNFMPDGDGRLQFVTTTGLVSAGVPGGGAVAIPANAIFTGHEFLIDVAHSAAPGNFDADGNPRTTTDVIAQVADSDGVIGDDGNAATYDNEMLDRHFVTGDGRGNENIGLTAMHSIFHSEHNRLVESYKTTLLASNDVATLNEWLATPLAADRDLAAAPLTTAEIDALSWNGQRLFQAGRFATEMQYQHMVFEEFSRAVSPGIDPFIFSNSADIDPAIVSEFANVVYRFGHSMLTDTVARADGNLVSNDIGLIEAFLNPPAFNEGGVDVSTAIADIVRGMSRQVGNEIDEFVVEALRNNLVGLPLDLAVLNLTRARETGAPTFNEARASFYAATGDTQFAPYTSWADLAPHLKNPASIVNFVAAYGEHPTILAADTVLEKRDAAMTLVLGGADEPADRLDFLNGEGAWSAANSGLNTVDFWIGGLAEAKLEFGGMLGPTFNYVFETQMENLQNGDRFYYLSRTQGLNMLNELENNSFSAMVMRNSDLGEAGNTTHLPGLLFSTPSYILEMDKANQVTGIVGDIARDETGAIVRDAAGAPVRLMNGDPTRDNIFLNAFNPLVTRFQGTDGADAGTAIDYNVRLDLDRDGDNDGDQLLSYAYDGGDHVVLGGTAGNDILLGGRGMDTVWGDAGNDRIDAGDEADQVHGGDGDDIITDHGTVAGGADFLRGNAGNDVISGGAGNDLLFGGLGKDFLVTGNDFSEIFAGEGDDFLLGGNGPDVLMGNEGSDWIEGGEGFDGIAGENSELFFNSPIVGHDVLNGGGNDTDYDGESGDDIMIQGPGIQRSNGMFGFDWASHKGDIGNADSDLGIPFFPAQTEFTLRDRFDSVEGLSGWNGNDVLTGAEVLRGGAAGAGGPVGAPVDESDLKVENLGLIDGLQELLALTDAQVAAMAPNHSVIDTTAGAEVIIGGAGSDTIRGNLGNDILDGDAWLNTRIRVTALTDNLATTGVDETANTAANQIMTVESLTELTAQMVAGEINPGQLHIVREIVQSATAATDVDTVVYGGATEEYTFTANADGTITIDHSAVALGVANDGTDLVRNFEWAKFADADVALVNVAPEFTSFAGAETANVQVDENTTFVAQLTAFDANLFGPLVMQQVLAYELAGGADVSAFTIDQVFGTLMFRTGPNFEMAADTNQDNIYDVVVRVTDGTLWDEQALFVEVMNANDPTTGELHLGDYTATAVAATLTALSTLIDEDAPNLQATFQWEQFDGAQWVAITDETSASLADIADITTRVVTTFNDGFGEQTIVSAETAIVGSAAANTLVGTAGNEIILGLGGNDTLTGGAGTDIVDGGLGDDTVLATVADGSDRLIGGEGADRYNLVGTSAAADINLTTGLSSSAQTGLDTLAGIENLTGSTGGDTMTDGVGSNLLDGGTGNDTFVMTADNARDTINGRGGSDTINYSANTTGLTVTLGTNSEVVGSGSVSGVGGTTDFITSINNIVGGSGADNITGNSAGNTIIGGGGNDTLAGGAGADFMDGGTGDDLLMASGANDTLIGGDGTDTYSLALTNAAATVNLTTGTSTSSSTGTDSLAGIENVIGSQAGDTITDGVGANVLTGGAGADRFILGNDGARDTVNGAGGTNTVEYTALTTANLTVALGAGSNEVVGSGTLGNTDLIASVNNFTGGAGNDSITGNAAGNRLLGGGGNDTLAGGAGVDFMDGGAGNDTLLASGGNDTLIGGAGTDTYSLAATAAAATVNLTTGSASSTETGTDTLSTIENVIGGSGVDTLTGDAGVNILTGNGGNDILNGAAGNDTLNGGDGNDTFVASVIAGATDGTDTMNGGLGTDTYTLASTTTAATVNLSTGTATSAQTGTDTLTAIENVTGSSAGDTMTDGAGANVLTGGAGEDIFIMTNDNARDTVNGAGGGNTINYAASATGITVTLADATVVTVLGSGTNTDQISNIDHVVGSNFADTITGDGSANQLTGGGGADTLAGGAGSDTLTGGDGNDTLLGNDGTDILNGGAGNDILTGGLNFDQSTGGTGADIFDFNSIAEIPNEFPALRDRVTDFTSGTDKLDFSGIDANVDVAGDQAFTMSTTAGDAFTANAQLRYHLGDPGSVMQGNVGLANGLVTDMQVALVGVTTLQTADIIG